MHKPKDVKICAGLLRAEGKEKYLLQRCILNTDKSLHENTLVFKVKMNEGYFCVKLRTITDGTVFYDGDIHIKNTKNTQMFAAGVLCSL